MDADATDVRTARVPVGCTSGTGPFYGHALLKDESSSANG